MMNTELSAVECAELAAHEAARSGTLSIPARESRECALDALSAHLAVLDESGTIVAVNRAWREFAATNGSGPAHSNVCEGANYLRVCDEAAGPWSEEASAMAAGIRAVLCGAQNEITIEYPCHWAGEERWFSASVTRFGTGAHAYVVVAHENISERIRAEALLREREALYHGLFENMLNAFAYCEMVFVDGKPQDCIYLAVNKAYERLTGFSDIVGKKVSEVIPGLWESDPQLLETYGRVASTGRPESAEMYVEAMKMWRALSVYCPAPGYFATTFDVVTERKQAEETLRRSETKYRSLYQSTSDAVMLMDERGYIDCNFATLAVFGCESRQEYCSKQLSDHSPPMQPDGTDSATAGRQRIREAIQNGNSRFEWVYRRADTGSTFVTEVLLSAMDLNGTPVVQAVVRDISERKQAEAALLENSAELECSNRDLEDAIGRANEMAVQAVMAEEMLREWEHSLNEAQHLAHVGSWRLNTATKETTWSMELYHILGRDPSLAAPHWSDMSGYVDPDDWLRVDSTFRRAIAEGEPCELEFRAIRSDGGRLWLWMTANAVSASSESTDWISGTVQDITERTLAEAALRDSEATLAEAMRVAKLAAWEYDVSGDLFTFNEQFYSLFGTTADREGGYTMPARSYTQRFVYPDDRAIVGLEIRKALSAADPEYQARVDHRILRTDGEIGDLTVAIRIQKDAAGRTVRLYGVNQDITERKQMLDSLSHLAQVVASSDDAIISFTLSGEIRTWNPGAERIYGYAADEAVGRNISMLVQSEYPTLIPRILEKIRNDDPIQRYEGIRIGKGGTKTDVSVNITSVRDSEGRIVGGVEMTRDVSRRNRAEQLLAKSRDFYLKLFEDFPALIWRSDSSGVFDYLNRCWLEFTGSTLESGLKNDWPGRVHPEDRKRVARAYQGAFRKRVPLRVEYRFRRADGSYRWIINQGRPYTDLDGTFAGFIGSCYDGTEMREAVEDHRRLMAAIEQASDAIVITAVDATIQYVNPAFERITGYSQRQAVGKNLSILRSGKHDAHFHADITNTVLTGNVWSGQLINRRKDGSCYTEFMTLSPVRNAAGKTINLVAISRDVSEQVAMETQLRQAQRLESIGQLAAGIAHEINTPTQYVGDNTLFLKDAFADLLTVLEAYASLATSAADGPVPYDLLKSVEDAVRAADIEYLAAEIPKAISQSQEGIERVAGIVRAMKEFSHPGTGEKTLLDINRAIETTLTVARNEWKYVAELELDLQPDLPMVPCLPGDMNQVILNIVVNAAHAITDVVGKDGASGKGIIRVQTRTSGRSVEIRITDSGNGIPEHVRARVFDPFFTTKGVGKGTGQGLAISHSVIVDKHGGTISFESESGKGTTFIVRLPLDGAAREAGPAAFEGDPASSGLPQHGDTGGESRGA